jgi:hypothetical protein
MDRHGDNWLVVQSEETERAVQAVEAADMQLIERLEVMEPHKLVSSV